MIGAVDEEGAVKSPSSVATPEKKLQKSLPLNNIFKENTANAIVTTDLLSSDNFEVAFAQLCNQSKGYNFNIVELTQK